LVNIGNALLVGEFVGFGGNKMSKETKKVEAFPTVSGTHASYDIEYQMIDDDADRWRNLIWKDAFIGIGTTDFSALTSKVIHQLPYAQAMALAWKFISETDGIRAVRLAVYRLSYDVKCYREEENETIMSILEKPSLTK